MDGLSTSQYKIKLTLWARNQKLIKSHKYGLEVSQTTTIKAITNKSWQEMHMSGGSSSSPIGTQGLVTKGTSQLATSYISFCYHYHPTHYQLQGYRVSIPPT